MPPFKTKNVCVERISKKVWIFPTILLFAAAALVSSWIHGSQKTQNVRKLPQLSTRNFLNIATDSFSTKNGEDIRFVDFRICGSHVRSTPPPMSTPINPPRKLRILSFISHGASFEPYADGYGEAMRLISMSHDVSEYNWAISGKPTDSAVASFDTFDYILVKSNWYWYLDDFVRQHLRNCKARLVLLISGTSTPPNLTEMRVYHTLFYETDWYWNSFSTELLAHGRAYKAFGINTNYMNLGIATNNPMFEQPRPFDFVFVGHVSFTLKRADVLMSLAGLRLAFGVIDTPDLDDVARLREAGVTVANGMGSYADLAAILRMSRNVIVPTPIWGGGERATLEARACGAHVWVADDNVKLQDLLCGPIPSHEDYARDLLNGLFLGFF
jgi:hypothetical protein